MRQLVRSGSALLLKAGIVLGWALSSLAIYFAAFGGFWIGLVLASLFAFWVPATCFSSLERKFARRRVFFAYGVILIMWVFISPSSSRDWTQEHAVLASAKVRGDIVEIRNMRRRTRGLDGIIEYGLFHRNYDLRQLSRVDFIVSRFSSLAGVAHTFLSFGFDNGDQIAVSVEARREEGEHYSPLAGLFKRYELIYVIGDERDLIGLRCAGAEERVYVYPTQASPAEARRLLLDMIQRASELEDSPEFYNTFTNNCATTLLAHVNSMPPFDVSYDLRILFPGYSDRLAHELGWIGQKGDFDELQKRCDVTDLARSALTSASFSRDIRNWQR